jgi:hypothetical protein
MRRLLSLGLLSAAIAAPIAVPALAQPTIGDLTNVNRPNFTVEAVSLKAIDETGVDFFGSDEIIVRFAVDNHLIFTDVFEDMDRGNTRAFPARMACITPAVDPDQLKNHNWSCAPAGRAAPITFDITLYEYDGALRGLLTNPTLFCLTASDDLFSDCHERTSLQSLALGQYRQAFTQAELLAALPTVGTSMTRRLRIDNCSAFVTIDNGACAYWSWLPGYFAYDVTVRVTRNANYRPGLEPSLEQPKPPERPEE